jgi:hypothetical protein
MPEKGWKAPSLRIDVYSKLAARAELEGLTISELVSKLLEGLPVDGQLKEKAAKYDELLAKARERKRRMERNAV